MQFYCSRDDAIIDYLTTIYNTIHRQMFSKIGQCPPFPQLTPMHPWHIQYYLKFQVGTEGDLEIKAYYAGHVLGAAMFLVRVRDQSIVYTVSPVLAYCSKAHKYVYPLVARDNEALMKIVGA